jgi:anthranilate synthase component 2
LRDYFLQFDVYCELVRNDELHLLQLKPANFDALVISPGPETPEKAGYLMQILPQWITALPVLGVCLGHQAIGELFGANLVQAKKPRHGKVDRMEHLGGVLFEKVPNHFLGTRYHSLILNNLPEELSANCWCEDEVMGLQHKSLPIFGLQFHPESCETQFGLVMVKNFIELSKNLKQI